MALDLGCARRPDNRAPPPKRTKATCLAPANSPHVRVAWRCGVHQRDYILRIIEQLGVALAEIRRRILRQEKTATVREALARTAGQAGLDIELLRGFDLETLRLLVMPTGEVEPARCWLMAEILYLDGLEATLSGLPAHDSLLKARALFDMVRPAGGMLVGMPEAAERIAEIDKVLEAEPHSRDDPESARPRRMRRGTGNRLPAFARPEAT